jgi:hypothetical protein
MYQKLFLIHAKFLTSGQDNSLSKESVSKYKKIVIIGAPRSGTNMLRDILTKFDGVGTWPCDEINYIWRHGNVLLKTDEFSRENTSLRIKNYINYAFSNLAKKNKLDFVVEKTCANSLRVQFVDEVLPDAIYIYIVRDGVDVVGSASLRWKAAIDWPYIMKKVYFVPFTDLPYYALRYLTNQVFRLFSKGNRLAFWGPLFHEQDLALSQYSLDEVCALQWKRCVDLSDEAFSDFQASKVIKVKYEKFVNNPFNEVSRILQHVGIPFSVDDIVQATSNISAHSIGKGRKNLNSQQLEKVNALVFDTLSKHGYMSTL